MGCRVIDSALTAVVLGVVTFSSQAIGADEKDNTEQADVSQETDESGETPDFPSELMLNPEKMPEPVQKDVLQRIREHERLERLLLDQPVEIRDRKTGD